MIALLFVGFMPLSTATTGGSGRTRSEAAIEAWKHRQRAQPKPGTLDPKIAARVKEILASKVKKPKGAKKPKAGKPKDARTSQEKANQNRAAVAKQGGMGDLEGTLVRVGAGMAKGGKDLEPEAHDELIKKGLAKRHADGSVTLSPAGHKWKSAADKGDADAAGAALSEASAGAADSAAKDKEKSAKVAARETAKAEREKSKAAKVAERAAKQKKQQQAAKQKVQARQKIAAEKAKARAAKDAAKLAKVAPAATTTPQATGKAIDMSDIDELAIKAGARHSKMDASHLDEAARHLHAAGATCPDCAPGEEDEDATKAIKGIMDNPAWYASHECGDIMQACSALQTLAMLIQSELSEEDEDDASIGQLVDAARTLITFIGGELDELEGAAGDAAELPNSASVQTMKGIELATLDDGEKIAVVSGYSVKALNGGGLVGGYLVKFGGDGDLSQWRDVFTKDTNFGKHKKSDVWVHHRMLPGLGQKQLTNQAELDMDDEGVFVKHLLDLRNAYEAKLYSMAQNGKLGWSSGTAPHLVDRKALGDGRHEVTQWTLGLDASYTPMPAGGFVVNAGAMKSLLDDAGIDLLNAMYIDDNQKAINPDSMRRDGVKMDDERARALLLDIELMELEETAL